ncbi:MAG: hypothetical protein A2Z21_01255 [Candidatus Fraserbacteria bacterium RBG_16_55_9]|uniref:Uncharacterized protein n=1 Tax=Fraserbacteria sp. (strain RBG_16_55_9) TaxID=1817864 RepID=A0A1F5UR93_FRAXR|nr:MAG: hypothetical protein A2Z21_01255 [Candidatus Fraserbacteria bacterium RBG_16_55_9]
MAIALMMRKDAHTPNDLRLLAQAPYFDVHLIRQKVMDLDYRPAPKLNVMTDEELLPAGTMIHSNSIARSTREALEESLGCQLPSVNREERESFMKSRELRALLVSHPELQSDPTVGELYQLLKLATGLGFTVGWCEDLEEKTPRGWR